MSALSRYHTKQPRYISRIDIFYYTWYQVCISFRVCMFLLPTDTYQMYNTCCQVNLHSKASSSLTVCSVLYSSTSMVCCGLTSTTEKIEIYLVPVSQKKSWENNGRKSPTFSLLLPREFGCGSSLRSTNIHETAVFVGPSHDISRQNFQRFSPTTQLQRTSTTLLRACYISEPASYAFVMTTGLPL